jgi:hypothetical protein
MKATLPLLAMMLVAASASRGADFKDVRLAGDEGSALLILRTSGKPLDAPKLGTQDSFDQPRLSANHRLVGWLALYPDKGASYSQPIELVVMDRAQQLHRFTGNWGMVFGWCFTPNSEAVIYRYQFPHGRTPVGFDMRRVSDGKLLRQFRLEPAGPDEDGDEVVRDKAPRWASCARASTASPP